MVGRRGVGEQKPEQDLVAAGQGTKGLPERLLLFLPHHLCLRLRSWLGAVLSMKEASLSRALPATATQQHQAPAPRSRY